MMRTSKEAMQIKVGAFILIGLFLGAVVIFLLGSEKNLFESHYTLIAYFDDISGLREGASVQLAGIQVGTIQRISFEKDLQAKKVKLNLKISKDYQNRIRKDSEASIVTQGLLGDKMMWISVGNFEVPVLKNGEEIKIKPPTNFIEVLKKGEGVLEEFKEVAENVNMVLQEIQKGDGILHGIIYEPRGKQIVRNLDELTQNLNEVGKNLEEISDKMRKGEGTLGALINDATLFNDMKTLLGKANRNKLIKAVVRETLRTKEKSLTGTR